MARPKNQSTTQKDSPNSELDLAEFDYQRLTGESYERYTNLVHSLVSHEKYDFEMWLASSERKFKLNEDTGEKEEYIKGIVLNGNKPIQITRLKVKDAIEMNKYVSHNTGERTNSKYYLLHKVVKKESETTA